MIETVNELIETVEQQNLFQQLLRIRMIEEAIASRYSEQKMRCPVHLSIGQEAIAVGVCSQLRKEDYVVSGHRAHAHYLAKGGSLKRMIAEMYGKKTGCSRGRGGSMHLLDLSVGFLGSIPIVGGSIPIGVGAAFASLLKKEDRVVVIFFGEGATEEGVFTESLNFAALKGLPVLFVCENNLYSVYSPLSVRQPSERSITALAEAHGIFAQKGDGNDLDEIVSLTEESFDYMRKNKRPALVEFSTYRLREHCGPHIDIFQPVDEVNGWKKRDPLRDISKEYADAIAEEIKEAFDFAEQSPFPEPDEEGSLYA